MDKSIETVRLSLRRFEEGGLREAFAWSGDPTAMRFTPGGPDPDMARTAARIVTSRHLVLDGYGTRKRMLRGTFRSVRVLTKSIHEYIRIYNNPRPFQWVASASRIIRKINKYRQYSEGNAAT